MIATAESAYREEIRSLRLPPSTLTAWGIAVIDTEGFQQATAGPPTGYTHDYLQNSLIQWHDPRTGGVAVILHDRDHPEPSLAHTPEPLGTFELMGNNHYTVSQSPARFGKFPNNLSRNLGFRVLAHTGPLTAIQLPGIRDYETAFKNVNGHPPDITADEAQTGIIKGRAFLDMVDSGYWPYDFHFFDAHAPALVIGGPEYVAAIHGMVRHVNPNSPMYKVNWLGGRIDAYADILLQGKAARTRVNRFLESGQIDDLYHTDNMPEWIFPRNRAVLRRFNGVLAHHLNIALPASELPDVSVPI